MGCESCKKKNNWLHIDQNETEEINKSGLSKLFSIIIRILIFALALSVLIPFIIIFSIIMVFNAIVLRKNFNSTKTLTVIGKLLTKKEKDDENSDEEDESEVEHAYIHDITPENK